MAVPLAASPPGRAAAAAPAVAAARRHKRAMECTLALSSRQAAGEAAQLAHMELSLRVPLKGPARAALG